MQYMPICMCLGISLGTAIGAALDNIGVWMCIGVSIGVGLGTAIDSANRAREKTPENEEQKEV